MLPAHVETSKTHRQLKKKKEKKTKQNKQTKKTAVKSRSFIMCLFIYILTLFYH